MLLNELRGFHQGMSFFPTLENSNSLYIYVNEILFMSFYFLLSRAHKEKHLFLYLLSIIVT